MGGEIVVPCYFVQYMRFLCSDSSFPALRGAECQSLFFSICAGFVCAPESRGADS